MIDNQTYKLIFFYLFLIFIALAYLAHNSMVQHVEYYNQQGEVYCVETYIHGKLNTTPCVVDNNYTIDTSIFIFQNGS